MKTDVIFRWDKGDCIALFPKETGTANAATCLCYVQMGGHGSADINGCMQGSRPATEQEKAPLRRELEQIGYTLKERKRTSYADYLSRKNEILAIEK